MKTLTLPSKIAWYVDLSQQKTGLFLDEIKRKIESEIYTTQVEFVVLDSSSILKLFFPLYIETMMSRSDFRLDKNETERKIVEIANNPSYELLWFRHADDKTPLGGIVVHHLNEEIRVAYRCFDHVAAKAIGLTKIDYYAESKMQFLARKLNYKKLCHGNDHHPVDQLGLSIYKLRIGARPALSHTATLIESSQELIKEMADKSGSAGYYEDLKGEYYSNFYLYGTTSDTTNIFIKAASTMGIGVVRL